jgi:hypothetical protein
MGHYKIVNDIPLNPLGRCGIKGRGLLGNKTLYYCSY